MEHNMELMEFSFGALWDYPQEIKSGVMSIAKADMLSKQAATEKATELKHHGWTVKRLTLRNQRRQYWGFNEPCGLVCTVYMIGATKLVNKE
jgi:hypothetical protein